MKLKSIVAATAAAGLLSGTAAFADVHFDTLRVQTIQQIETQITLVKESLALLRNYRNHQGVFLPSSELAITFDRGPVKYIRNDVTVTATGDEYTDIATASQDGRLVIHFKDAADGENANAVLNNKTIIFLPRKDGIDAVSGNPFYSYDHPFCGTDITLGKHHGFVADEDGSSSELLKFANYFRDFECKYDANVTASTTLYNDLKANYGWTDPTTPLASPA